MNTMPIREEDAGKDGVPCEDFLEQGARTIDLEAPLSQYRELGYARIGKVLSDRGITQLRERAEALMMGRVVHPGMFFQLDSDSGRFEDLRFGNGYEGPSLNYRKIEKLERDPLYGCWLSNPLFQRITERVIGADVSLYRAILMGKRGQGGTVLPWHQDAGLFWGLDRDPELQIWTALDDVPLESGCVEVLSGSHRSGLVTPLGGIVPPDRIDAERITRDRVHVPVKAGEVILLHNYVWHRSLVNQTDHARRAFSVCYMHASTRCTRKKRAPREFVRVW